MLFISWFIAGLMFSFTHNLCCRNTLYPCHGWNISCGWRNLASHMSSCRISHWQHQVVPRWVNHYSYMEASYS